MAELLGNILGGIIQMKEDNEEERSMSQLLTKLDTVMHIIFSQDTHQSLLNIMENKSFLFQSIFPSDGLLVYMEDNFITHNFPFSKEEIKQFINDLKQELQKEIFYTNHLASILPNLSESILKLCSGLMVIRLETKPTSIWIWRRAEKTQRRNTY